MNAWKPATVPEVEAQLETEVKALHPAYRSRFQKMRVPCRTVPVDVHPGERVVVVAEHEGKILYHADIDGGWDLEVPTASGGIPDRGVDQFEIRHIMWQLFGDAERLG